MLVVDDMATERAMVKAIFKGPDYEVIEAKNGEEALEILRTSDIDTVLLDVMMPGMDGFELCRHIRLDTALKLLPVIMLTSLDSAADIRSGMEAGASEFISKPVNRIEIEARVSGAITLKRVTDQLVDAETILFTIARVVEYRDYSTGAHCGRLSQMADVFGRSLGLREVDIESLKRGAVMHDIGKVGISDSILAKNGPLTDKEWLIMQTHTIIGAKLLDRLKKMAPVIEIIRHHHERYDGTGYPDGLSGEDIPFLARVFQIMDIYDALSSKRPYKEAYAREIVIEKMKSETDDGKWDPKLMKAFLSILINKPEAFDYDVDSAHLDWKDDIAEIMKTHGHDYTAGMDEN